MNENKKYYFSVIVPVFNEEENIDNTFIEISKVLDQTKQTYEFVFVNDGSTDLSSVSLKKLAEKYAHVKVVNLSRNFGQEPAILAGLQVAQGELIFLVDCDLQDTPKSMLDLIEKQKEGYDVVYGVRKKRKGETWLKKWTSKWFYKIFDKTTNLKMPKDTGLYRLFTKRIKDEILQLKEKNKFLRAMFTWVGFKQTGVEFVREERAHGKTKYTYKKLNTLAINSIVAYSPFPITFLFFMSMIIGFLSAATLIVFIVLAILHIFVGVGAWIIAVVTLCTALILFGLSVVGLYVYKTLQETQRRPDYIISDTINVD